MLCQSKRGSSGGMLFLAWRCQIHDAISRQIQIEGVIDCGRCADGFRRVIAGCNGICNKTGRQQGNNQHCTQRCFYSSFHCYLPFVKAYSFPTFYHQLSSLPLMKYGSCRSVKFLQVHTAYFRSGTINCCQQIIHHIVMPKHLAIYNMNNANIL